MAWPIDVIHFLFQCIDEETRLQVNLEKTMENKRLLFHCLTVSKEWYPLAKSWLYATLWIHRVDQLDRIPNNFLKVLRFSNPVEPSIPLSQFQNLQRLSINLKGFSPAHIIQLFKSPIVALGLHGTIEDWYHDLEVVGCLSRLKEFETSIPERDAPEFYYTLSQSLTDLTHLYLGKTWITDHILLKLVERSHRLKVLSLEENFELTDKGICQVADICPNLVAIKLRNCIKISDQGVKCIAREPLQALGIAYTNCTDNSISALTDHCPNLHTLFMNNIHVTPQVLIRFLEARGSQLRIWSLTGLELDGVAPSISKHCTQLQRLNLSDCDGISMEEFKDILNACPLETILFDGFTSEKYENKVFWLHTSL